MEMMWPEAWQPRVVGKRLEGWTKGLGEKRVWSVRIREGRKDHTGSELVSMLGPITTCRGRRVGEKLQGRAHRWVAKEQWSWTG